VVGEMACAGCWVVTGQTIIAVPDGGREGAELLHCSVSCSAIGTSISQSRSGQLHGLRQVMVWFRNGALMVSCPSVGNTVYLLFCICASMDGFQAASKPKPHTLMLGHW
jgi:hypothetical protein